MVCFDVCFVVVIVEGGCCFVVVDFFVMVVGVCEIEFQCCEWFVQVVYFGCECEVFLMYLQLYVVFCD